MPGQFGPIRRVCFVLQIFLHLHHVERRNSLRDAHHERNAGVGRFHDCVRGKCRRHVNHRSICACFFYCVRNSIENGNAFVRCAAFSGRHATDDVRSILNHLLRMKRAFFAGDSLHDQARVFINQNAQAICSLKLKF